MTIKLVPDVVAPLVVAGADIAVERLAPTYGEWLEYAAAAGGYASAAFNFGGDFAKNIGIAALPLAAKRLYGRITSGRLFGGRMAWRPSNPGGYRRSYDPRFETAVQW